jgi:signal transduction histidine kinase
VRTRPGEGLGLYIVRELARAHGGSVRAHDAEGGGFQVDISLPLKGERPAAAAGEGGRAA